MPLNYVHVCLCVDYVHECQDPQRPKGGDPSGAASCELPVRVLWTSFRPTARAVYTLNHELRLQPRLIFYNWYELGMVVHTFSASTKQGCDRSRQSSVNSRPDWSTWQVLGQPGYVEILSQKFKINIIMCVWWWWCVCISVRMHVPRSTGRNQRTILGKLFSLPIGRSRGQIWVIRFSGQVTPLSTDVSHHPKCSSF